MTITVLVGLIRVFQTIAHGFSVPHVFSMVSEDNCVIGGIYFCIFVMMQQRD